MDKAWAHKSGLGWIGKHSNLITRELGSWVFLAEVVLNLDLEPDAGEAGTIVAPVTAASTPVLRAQLWRRMLWTHVSASPTLTIELARSHSQGIASHDWLAYLWL